MVNGHDHIRIEEVVKPPKDIRYTRSFYEGERGEALSIILISNHYIIIFV